jgi:hypothetical protein
MRGEPNDEMVSRSRVRRGNLSEQEGPDRQARVPADPACPAVADSVVLFRCRRIDD